MPAVRGGALMRHAASSMAAALACSSPALHSLLTRGARCEAANSARHIRHSPRCHTQVADANRRVRDGRAEPDVARGGENRHPESSADSGGDATGFGGRRAGQRSAIRFIIRRPTEPDRRRCGKRQPHRRRASEQPDHLTTNSPTALPSASWSPISAARTNFSRVRTCTRRRNRKTSSPRAPTCCCASTRLTSAC